MRIPGIEFDGIEGQKFDNGFEIEPGRGIALEVSYPGMQVRQRNLRKLTILRLAQFL